MDEKSMWTYYVHIMKTATVRDLRNSFSTLEAWLLEGEAICIEKRGQPIGLLTAWRSEARVGAIKPDFAARRQAIWGKRVFTEAEVAGMRADELEGEEG
jgi:antitoxin (DNA-binding transcriptional repressor) of toxin-antitoxin stability system